MLQGYTLTGRTGLFPSYEAFLGIIDTMMVQYCKFVKMVSFSIICVSFVYSNSSGISGARDELASALRFS